jgi:hypothetical protein
MGPISYGADLSGANLREADLYGANLLTTDLISADLREADLRQATFIDSRLDGADLTGAKLWETQRTGWSINGVACRQAYWDRNGKEPTDHADGEFERLFAEKPRIVLRYSGGVSPVDLAMLPLIVERLQVEHPGSKLAIRSLQDDAGGASVTITVEDLEGRDAGVFEAEVERLRADFATVQQRLLHTEEVKRALEAEYRGYKAAAVALIGGLRDQPALPQQSVYFITGPTVIEGTVMCKGDTYNTTAEQVGGIGRNAHVHDNTFQQVQGGLDLPKLADELGRLRTAMRSEAETREQDKAVGVVADAEEAAAKGDGATALRHLKAAGKWTLGIAEKIGVPLAIEYLKRGLL